MPGYWNDDAQDVAKKLGVDPTDNEEFLSVFETAVGRLVSPAYSLVARHDELSEPAADPVRWAEQFTAVGVADGRLNGTYRRQILGGYAFKNLIEVRDVTEDWKHMYNTISLYKALGGISHLAYVQQNSRVKKLYLPTGNN